MPKESGTKYTLNCARADGTKSQANNLPGDILSDL